MPRIDPLQLLKCLSVLLSPDGGILSRDEVPRLVNLMTKFSKKLVSKCVYVLILKNTETSLVDMFMAEGGWTLVQTWLQDSNGSGNWDLVKEILQLLLVTPVDVERLKMNCLPRMVKNLSRREELGDVAELSNRIVQNWLTIVKGQTPAQSAPAMTSQDQQQQQQQQRNGLNHLELDEMSEPGAVSAEKTEDTTFYRVTLKDGKQVIRKLSLDGEESASSSSKNDGEDSRKSTSDREKEKSSSSRSKSSSRDKDRDRRKSSSSSSSSRSKSSSSKDRDRRDKESDRKRSGSSSSRSSSKSGKDHKKESSSKDKSKKIIVAESKEKQAEKDKDTLAQIRPQTLDKLGRIPKKSSGSSSKEIKKPTFSILNRKASGEEAKKTVKVFNSKMRSTGLEEEAKPPPPRSSGGKKPTPSVQLPTIPPATKRPSPPPSRCPPEKKPKIEAPERPGAIKLIPPKPKRGLVASETAKSAAGFCLFLVV